MKTVSVQELKQQLDEDRVLLIDVREPEEYQTASIEGAHLIPLGQVDISQLPSRDKPIVIHCRSGKRSAMACQQLLAQDPSLDVYSLDGGIMAWEQAGFEIKKDT